MSLYFISSIRYIIKNIGSKINPNTDIQAPNISIVYKIKNANPKPIISIPPIIWDPGVSPNSESKASQELLVHKLWIALIKNIAPIIKQNIAIII